MATDQDLGQGVFVELNLGDKFDAEKVSKIAAEARSMFEGMPGLRQKVFTFDEAGRRATNFYLWDSAEQARAFFSPQVEELIVNLYGVAPTITYVDVAAIVENAHV